MDAALQQDYNQPASLANGRVTKRQDILLGVGTVLFFTPQIAKLIRRKIISQTISDISSTIVPKLNCDYSDAESISSICPLTSG